MLDILVAVQLEAIHTLWQDDPRDLYGPVHEANSPCPEFVHQFLLRVDDLIRKYQPDLLYFDDAVYHVLDRNDRLRVDAVLGMPDLINQLVTDGHAPQVQYVLGHWMDINDLDDVTRAGDFAYGQAAG